MAATGLAALGILAPTLPAGAAAPSDGGEVSPRQRYCIDFKNATGCFESNGDHILVHDDKADGLKPSVEWRTDYGRKGTCTWRGTSYWTDCNYNMRERSRIDFRVWQRGSRYVYISGWRSGHTGG